MQRVKRTTAVAVLPADPAGGTPGYFPLPNPGGGIPAAVPGYEWYNNVQEEIVSIIAAAGIALDGSARNQMLLALRAAGVFTSPAQFDNTTKAATTAFVKTAGQQHSATTSISSATTFTAANCGQFTVFNSASNLSHTLPAANAVPPGTQMQFENVNTGLQTLNRAGADSVQVNSSTVNSLVLGNGDTLTLESNGSNAWFATGGSVQLQYSATFLSSIGTSGYIKLPGGLILQWGTWSASGTSGNPVAVTFPLAFPSGLRALVAFETGASATTQSAWGDTPGTAGFNGRATGISVTCYYLALGN